MKRWLVRIVVFLLLVGGGAIVNVAVAWGCACWSTIPPETPIYVPTTTENAIWHRCVETANDATCSVRTACRGLTYLQISGALEPNSFRITPTTDGGVSGVSTDIWPNEVFGKIVVVFMAGWPRHSLDASRCEARSPIGEQPGGSRWISIQKGSYADDPWLTYPPRDDTTYKAAIPITIMRDGEKQYRMIPLRPLWPGFAINTVFYAAVLWLLFAGPFVVRRWRRIRRGLCPKCAYDLRGATGEVCPECGARK